MSPDVNDYRHPPGKTLLERLRDEFEWRNAPQLSDEDEMDTAALCLDAIEEIERLERDAALFAADLRDRHIRIKIDRHGDVYGQLCAVCDAEDAQPHKPDCTIGKALAFLANLKTSKVTLKGDR